MAYTHWVLSQASILWSSVFRRLASRLGRRYHEVTSEMALKTRRLRLEGPTLVVHGRAVGLDGGPCSLQMAIEEEGV